MHNGGETHRDGPEVPIPLGRSNNRARQGPARPDAPTLHAGNQRIWHEAVSEPQVVIVGTQTLGRSFQPRPTEVAAGLRERLPAAARNEPALVAW